MSYAWEDSGSHPQVSKRLKSPGIDRISALPEALIIHILSFLPTTRDRLRTGSLSKRWRNLWTCVPDLYLSRNCGYWGGSVPVADFVKRVNRILFLILLSGGSKVKSFVVRFAYEDAYADDVNVWTRFAARNETQKFVLDFERDEDEVRFYELPQSLYTNSFFKELVFRNCNFRIGGSVSWNSLKKLTISCGEFSNEVLEKIVAGAPALETLDLCLNAGISRFHFGNSGLKKLVLHIEDWQTNDQTFEISAPSVQSLEVSGLFKTCKLVDMASLVEASLFGQITWSDLTEYPVLTQEVLYSLLNVHTLTLGTWVIQAVAKLPTNDGCPLFPKCKCLTLETHLWKEDPGAIASVLESTPAVETLMVTISDVEREIFEDNPPGHGNSNTDQYWTCKEMGSNYLTTLTTVKFLDFWVYRGVAFAFVEFLLKNARGLQKVIIYLDTEDLPDEISATELFETSQKLLSFPRSSPDAKLLIHQ